MDQDDATPTGTDLSVRTNFINRAQREWALAYDWDVLVEEYKFMPSEASQATISLPQKFKKMESPVYDYGTGGYTRNPPYEYPVVESEDKYIQSSSNQFGYVMGNEVDGFNLIVPKGFESGTSLSMQVSKFPSDLATLSDTSKMVDPEFLIQRGIHLVLESRGDARFPQAKAEADKILARLVEHENALKFGGGVTEVRNRYKLRKSQFRIGRR